MKKDKKFKAVQPSSRDVYLPPEGEPVMGHAHMPVIFFLALAILIYWAMMYLDKYAGGFHHQVYEPYSDYTIVKALQPKEEGSAILDEGREVYGRTCVGCHQPNGMGSPPNPPLAGSEWVLSENPARMIRIVLDGLQGPITVKGASFDAQMLPWRTTLNDQEIAAVISYVRNDWGNKVRSITAAEVKAIRDETASKGEPWTAADLLKIPVE